MQDKSVEEKAKSLVDKYGLDEALSRIETALTEMVKKDGIKIYYLKVREEIIKLKK